jgi:hypothetical protein
MIATALRLPARDLYFSQPGDIKGTTLEKHPWYADATDCSLPASCVIKSHERAETKRHPDGARVIHLMRDGRDVCVSKYFYDRQFRTSNERVKYFDVRLQDYIAKTAVEWAKFVDSWSATGVITAHYETMLDDPRRELRRLITAVGASASDEQIDKAVKAHDRENMRRAFRAAYAGADFVRKGVAGDWTNYFSAESHHLFLVAAGKTMQRAGYSAPSSRNGAGPDPASGRATHLEVWELSGFEDGGTYSVTGELGPHGEQLLAFLRGKGWSPVTNENSGRAVSHKVTETQESSLPKDANIGFLGAQRVDKVSLEHAAAHIEVQDALLVSASWIRPSLVFLVGKHFRPFSTHGDYLVLARRSPTCPVASRRNRWYAWVFIARALAKNLPRGARSALRNESVLR